MEQLEDRRLLSGTASSAGIAPTANEQYLLELINRGRANPSAEAARYKIDLNAGLPAGTISTTPKQPLAFSPLLNTAARGHSQWMIDTNDFSHLGREGSNAGARMQAAGYQFVGAWGWAENISWKGTTAPASTINYIEYLNDRHADLYSRPEHRMNQMHGSYREVGLGVVQGRFTSGATTYNALMITEDFAVSGTSVFLTGVVYDDGRVRADRFYTPGEGLGGVTIAAVSHADGQRITTKTWASGGYSLPLPAGTYTVTASGGPLDVTLVKNSVTIGQQNVKIDFTLADNVAPIITGLSASPATVLRPGQITLTVEIESASQGMVARVEFYWDGVLLGTDNQGNDGWSWTGNTGNWTPGQHIFSARAWNHHGTASQWVTTNAWVVTDFAPIDFGVVPLFTTRQIEVTLNNDGPQPLIVDPATLDPPYAVRPVDGAGQVEFWTIEPGSSRSFIVSFSPSALGSHEAILPLIGDEAGRTIQHQGQAADGWQNPNNRFDVDGNGVVTAQDVLFLINAIHCYGAFVLPPRTTEDPGPPFFFDPNGDGKLTPSDVLFVINEINRLGSSDPEGEADLASRAVHSLWEPPITTSFQQTIERPSDNLAEPPQQSRRAATTTDPMPFPVAESNRSVQDRAADAALLAMVADDPLSGRRMAWRAIELDLLPKTTPDPVDLILADDDLGNRSPPGRPVDGRRP